MCMGAPHNGADLIFSSRAGLKIPNFQWPQTGEWHAWESYLYALVWLRLTVIEHQLMTVGTNFNDIWDEEKFPRITASTEAFKLQSVVQILRHPKLLAPSWDAVMPRFPPSARMYFEARPLCDYLHRISKFNPGGPQSKLTGGKNSRLFDSRLVAGGWWQLVSNPYCRSKLLQLLEIFEDVGPTDKRCVTCIAYCLLCLLTLCLLSSYISQHEAFGGKRPGRPTQEKEDPVSNC